MNTWDCSNPVLARPIQSIKCGTSPPSGKTWPLCPANASIPVGFGFFSLELAVGSYTGLFTLAAAVSLGGTGVLTKVRCICDAWYCQIRVPTNLLRVYYALHLRRLTFVSPGPLPTSSHCVTCRSTAAASAPSILTPTAWRAPTALHAQCLSASHPTTRTHLTPPLTMSRACRAVAVAAYPMPGALTVTATFTSITFHLWETKYSYLQAPTGPTNSHRRRRPIMPLSQTCLPCLVMICLQEASRQVIWRSRRSTVPQLESFKALAEAPGHTD